MAKTIFVLIALTVPYDTLAKNNIGHANLSGTNHQKYDTYRTIPTNFYSNNQRETVTNKNPNERFTSESNDENVPYSEHEEPRNISTRPNYTTNGQLIYPKTKEELLDFVPTKLYTQVRGKHTVKRVPREHAVEEAKTDEEKENAKRLREVVTNKKTNTIYTEEGYEDSAYDHAGHIRDADFREKYGRKLKNEYDERDDITSPKITVDNSDDVVNEETRHPLSIQKKKNDVINPERIVFDGIKNLEKDLTADYTKADQDLHQYHERISRSRPSDESYEDDANYRKNDDSEEEDYDASSERSEEQRSISSNNSEERDSRYTKNSAANVDAREQRSKENTSNIRSHEDFRGERSRSSENGSYKSKELSEEGDNNNKRYKYPTSASVEEYNQSTDYNEESENHSSSEEISTIRPQPREQANFKNYRPDVGTLKQNHATSPIMTTLYSLMDTTQPTMSPDILWENFKRRQNERGLRNSETKKTKNTQQDDRTADSTIIEQPHYESLVATPASIEPLTMKPYYRSRIPTVRIETSTTAEETESQTPKRYRFKSARKPSTSSYTTQRMSTPSTTLPTTYPTPTSTEKKTEFDHNPYLSPYAKRFDRKLKRYHPISRDKTETDETEDESKPYKYENTTRDESSEESSESPSKRRRIKKKILPKVERNTHQKNYKIKNPATSQEVTNLKPQKYKNRMKPAKIVRYRKPILGVDGSYDPILNAYILPKVFNEHLYPQQKIYRPSHSDVKRSYTVYDFPIIRRQIPPQKFYQSGQTILRFRRSAIPYDEKNLSTTLQNGSTKTLKKKIGTSETNKIPISFQNEPSQILRSENIVKGVIDEEIKTRFPSESDLLKKGNKTYSPEPVSIEVPELDEMLFDKNKYKTSDYSFPTKETIDHEKYPFYKSELAKSDPTLKYILNPNYVPKKTFGGMEFYDSRIFQCKDVEPDLGNVLPDEKEVNKTRGYNEDLPRLKELGDKLDCFKTKYFDPNPLDNPLFMEKRIDSFDVPTIDNPVGFSSRISNWSNEKSEYARSASSKTPEYKTDKTKEQRKTKVKPKPKYVYKKPYIQKMTSDNKEAKKKKRKRLENKETLVPLRLYGNQVYDDVMGTITKSQSEPKKKKFVPRKRTREKKESPGSINSMKNLSEESSDEVGAVKLRFVPKNYKSQRSSKLEANDTIPVLNVPLLEPPKKVRVVKGGPYLSVNISKPKGSKLRINYRAIPNNTRYGHGHSIRKRSVVKNFSEEIVNKSENSATDSTGLIADQTNHEKININTSKKSSAPRKRKSKKENGKYGPFSANPTQNAHTDGRRNEPRYNPNNEFNPNSESTKLPLQIIVPNVTASPSELYTPAGTVILINHDSSSNTQIPITNENITKPRIYPKTKKIRNDEQKSINESDALKKINKRYEVHEVINENESKQKLKSKPKQKLESEEYDAKSEEYQDLQTNITTRGTEAEDESLSKENSKENSQEKSSKYPSSDSRENSQEKSSKYSSSDSRENSQEKSSKYSSSEQLPPVSKTRNVSSQYTSAEEPNPRDDHDSDEKDSLETEREDDKEPFTRYQSRPYSPAQYYYDPKYADLGPRIDKPAFYHPRFKTPRYERRKYNRNVKDTSAESYENNDSNESYQPSWDRNDGHESKHFVHTIKRYEYPWEKRDRLAREKKRREHHYHSKEEDEDRSDDEDAASSENFFSYFPWRVKIYDIPRPRKTNKKNISLDNDEGTSNVSLVTSKPKLKTKVSVNKVNRTIVAIENNPILQTRLPLENNKDKALEMKSNTSNLTIQYAKIPGQTKNRNSNIFSTKKPNEKILTPTPTLTANPLIANMKDYSNIEILKTNPRIKAEIAKRHT